MLLLLMALLSQVHIQVTGSPPFPSVPEMLESFPDSVAPLQEQVLDWYLSHGYPFASISMYLSSQDTLVVNTVPGRHALLEAVVFPDSIRTSEEILTRRLNMSSGDVYSFTDVERWLTNLEHLQFIERAGPPLVSLGPGGNIVLVVPVQEAPAGWFSGDLDYSGSSGLSGGAETLFSNLFGTGRRLELSLNSVPWGGMNSEGLYREPWILGSDLSVEVQASQLIPDSGSVIREASGSLILELGRFEVSGGGGVWSSYPVSSGDEFYRYGSAGFAWDLTRKVLQGSQGFSGSLTTDAGNASGPDSSWLLSRADCRLSFQRFRGLLGAGVKAYAGGITSGEWLSTMLESIGGYGTLRGYVQDSWRAGTWCLGTLEISVGETETRLYGFADGGILKTSAAVEYPLSAGLGIRGSSGPLSFDAGAGVPIERGISSARFYLSARIGI
ncbi:hypothetical protein CSA37_09645 [Candidatus Fermentibacteria bacterium]|nr:MAG: hypothetical protein CSA37_09645 [Candidatus Fermentibacteria bacterium]